MHSNSVIISDFVSVVQAQESLSNICTRDRWEILRYQTAEVSGCGLFASPKTLPQPVEIDPGLQGWYKIYLCMADAGGRNYIEVKLTDDEFASIKGPGDIGGYIRWIKYEKFDETFWRAADMTGQRITIAKPDNGSSYTASLMWIRFVPMSDDEVLAYEAEFSKSGNRTMYAHMDEDFSQLDQADFSNLKDCCRHIWQMKDSDVAIVAQEISDSFYDIDRADAGTYVDRSGVGESQWGSKKVKQAQSIARKRKEILKQVVDYTHKCGMEYFVANRMSMSTAMFPYPSCVYGVPFVEKHPEFFCKSRDGKQIAYLSYAYKEVRDYMVESLVPFVRMGVDGITLLFTRGICVLFEQPVIDRFVAKYGSDIDFCRLPNDDPRVMEIKSDVMMDYMRALRNALDAETKQMGRKRVKIYVASYFTAEASKMDGIDVEQFAREGLIDGVIQSNMTVWEETEDVRDADGLIDLNKYAEKALNDYVICRAYTNNLERTLQGIDTYNRIAEETGIHLYSELQWENSAEPEEFAAFAEAIYGKSKGAIALWDSYPWRVMRLPEWYCTSRLGSKEHIDKLMNDHSYRYVHKVLTYNGTDISLYHPSWRG